MFKEEENWFRKRILKPFSDTYYLGRLIITGEEVRDETFKLFQVPPYTAEGSTNGLDKTLGSDS